jgi:hypothetical protein
MAGNKNSYRTPVKQETTSPTKLPRIISPNLI